jgi:hypothetical protein
MVRCQADGTHHGSDHHMIELELDIKTSEERCEECLAIRNAPWKQIREKIAANLEHLPGEEQSKIN